MLGHHDQHQHHITSSCVGYFLWPLLYFGHNSNVMSFFPILCLCIEPKNIDFLSSAGFSSPPMFLFLFNYLLFSVGDMLHLSPTGRSTLATDETYCSNLTWPLTPFHTYSSRTFKCISQPATGVAFVPSAPQVSFPRTKDSR